MQGYIGPRTEQTMYIFAALLWPLCVIQITVLTIFGGGSNLTRNAVDEPRIYCAGEWVVCAGEFLKLVKICHPQSQVKGYEKWVTIDLDGRSLVACACNFADGISSSDVESLIKSRGNNY